MIKGPTRYQPEVARGTSGTRITRPTRRIANPARIRLAGRCPADRFPAMIAVANIVSDMGASVSPASIALYSNTICR